MSEDRRDSRFMWQAVGMALKKAYEHDEYSIHLTDPNDLRLPGLAQLRRGEPATFTEEEMAVLGGFWTRLLPEGERGNGYGDERIERPDRG